MTLMDSSRGISFSPYSKNTPSSPLSHLGSKTKALTEEKSDDELPEGIRYSSSISTSVIDVV